MRVLEQALHQMAHFGAGGFSALDQGRIDESAPVFGVGDVPLLLKNPNGSENRVIGEHLIARQAVQNLLDGGRPPLPEDFHEPELGFGKGRRRFRRHSLFLPNIAVKALDGLGRKR